MFGSAAVNCPELSAALRGGLRRGDRVGGGDIPADVERGVREVLCAEPAIVFGTLPETEEPVVRVNGHGEDSSLASRAKADCRLRTRWALASRWEEAVKVRKPGR